MSSNSWGSLREREVMAICSEIVLLVGVGSNSSGDKVSTCWELHVVLQKEVRLLVGLLGEGGS